MNDRVVLLAPTLLILSILASVGYGVTRPDYNAEQKRTLQSLSLASLPALSSDPTNRYADNPAAAALGKSLFFDSRLSSNGAVSCGTCHRPELGFSDGLPLSIGVGRTDRKAMTVVGAAFSPWLFWDGREDSQWAQATRPLESAVEHNMTRTGIVKLIATHYRDSYESVFDTLPDFSDEVELPASASPARDAEANAAWDTMSADNQQLITTVFVNVAKAIAAYERQLEPRPSRFDRYVNAVLDGDEASAKTIFSAAEITGLKLFIGDGNCTDCHSGSLFTSHDFHNTGVPQATNLPPDTGRAAGAHLVAASEFNCLSRYSDAAPGDCAELRFLKTDGPELERAFKVPSLRNVANLAPYMHAGQFATLREVLNHYNEAPEAPAGHSELVPLDLSEKQLGQLEAFLMTLTDEELP